MKPLIIPAMLMTGLLLLGAAPPQDPGRDPDPPPVTGTQQGNRVGVEIAKPTKLVVTGDTGGSGDGYRIKRPCWYEPFGSAEEMFRFQTEGRTQFRRILADEESFLAFIQQFKDKLGQEGTWWMPTYNKADPDGAACWAGLEQFLFAPPNTTPPSGITLQQLAEIARAALTVPEHRIELNPEARSYVNLPTWVWVEGIGAPRRTVTASIPGFMSVTVVATLQDIRIDPGTGKDRAEVHEEGCGASGKPYTKGGTFTCGVRYLRSSIDQPGEKYTLTVSTVWPVAVQGDAAGIEFAPVELQTTRDVQVGEIQSNVRP